jgi:hypothetical protein
MQNKITSFINTVYGNSEVNHLYFRDTIITGELSEADAYAYAATVYIMNGTETKTTITFNNSQLGNNSTREYIAATILHEAVHAWINFKYPVPVEAAQQHNLMASTSRFNTMRDALLEIYPNLSPQDAIDLTWGGLYETILFNSLTPSEKHRIIERN